jgi:hypothetical protein
VTNALIEQSPYEAVQWVEGTISGVNLNNVTIAGTGTFALQEQTGDAGAAERARTARHRLDLADRPPAEAPSGVRTQHRLGVGGLVLHPAGDPAYLDKRRRAMGLGPFAEYNTRIPSGGVIVTEPSG